MKPTRAILFLFIIPLVSLTSCLFSPIRTEHAIFLFDNGEKNMVSSMLKYAEQHDKARLDNLDFRIIFMGASVDAMTQEPFCHYKNKLIHYKNLGIQETIDNTWKRDRALSEESMQKLYNNFRVTKKIWTGVSCSIFGQIFEKYHDRTSLETVALRDNPNPQGDTDYFIVADDVQSKASTVAVPSQLCAQSTTLKDKQVTIIGHPPTEEWLETAQHVDKDMLIKQLGLNPHLPIIVYAGVYGDFYEHCFKLFLAMIQDEQFTPLQAQILIAPHPRYKGIVEKKLCSELRHNAEKLLIVGEWEEEKAKKIKTVEALALADLVITADATSTVVTQAKALKKEVVHINPAPSKVSDELAQKRVLQRVADPGALIKIIKNLGTTKNSDKEDIFQLLGIPRNGAQLLWENFIG